MEPTAMIQSSAIAAVVSNPRLPDNPIVACNAAFSTLTGYKPEEIIGRNCRFLAGKDTEASLTDALRTGIRDGQPVLAEILNYKKDGTPFRNAVMIAPVFGPAGEIEYFLGSQVEVGEPAAHSMERRREAALRQVNGLRKRQREVLLHMAAGKLNKQIAHDLGLGERTVKMHKSAALAALGVRSVTDAIRIAIEAGF